MISFGMFWNVVSGLAVGHLTFLSLCEAVAVCGRKEAAGSEAAWR